MCLWISNSAVLVGVKCDANWHQVWHQTAQQNYTRFGILGRNISNGLY